MLPEYSSRPQHPCPCRPPSIELDNLLAPGCGTITVEARFESAIRILVTLLLSGLARKFVGGWIQAVGSLR